MSEALAAARLKKSDFVNKKSPSARGCGGDCYVAREGVRSRYVSVFIILSTIYYIL